MSDQLVNRPKFIEPQVDAVVVGGGVDEVLAVVEDGGEVLERHPPDFGFASAPVDVQRYDDGRLQVPARAAGWSAAAVRSAGRGRPGGRRGRRGRAAGAGHPVEGEARRRRVAARPRPVEAERHRPVGGDGTVVAHVPGGHRRTALGQRGVPGLRHRLPGAERPRQRPPGQRITQVRDRHVGAEAALPLRRHGIVHRAARSRGTGRHRHDDRRRRQQRDAGRHQTDIGRSGSDHGAPSYGMTAHTLARSSC